MHTAALLPTVALLDTCTLPHCWTAAHCCTAAHCRTLPHTAAECRTAAHCRKHCHTRPGALQHTSAHCHTHPCILPYTAVLPHTAAQCRTAGQVHTVSCTARQANTAASTATYCHVLPHTATYCCTLPHCTNWIHRSQVSLGCLTGFRSCSVFFVRTSRNLNRSTCSGLYIRFFCPLPQSTALEATASSSDAFFPFHMSETLVLRPLATVSQSVTTCLNCSLGLVMRSPSARVNGFTDPLGGVWVVWALTTSMPSV
jgi:hypothetical protein